MKRALMAFLRALVKSELVKILVFLGVLAIIAKFWDDARQDELYGPPEINFSGGDNDSVFRNVKHEATGIITFIQYAIRANGIPPGPESIPACLLKATNGTLRYYVEGTSCRVVLGNYNRDGLVISWKCDVDNIEGQWHMYA